MNTIPSNNAAIFVTLAKASQPVRQVRNEMNPIQTHPSKQRPVLVIGAGLAGLGCALRLQEHGLPYRLVERCSQVGGLARSERINGYTVDATGHWMHLRDPSIRALVEGVLQDNHLWIERRAAIWLGDRLIPYPFQSNVWALPPEERRRCLLGYVKARREASRRDAAQQAPPADFASFVRESLGDGIAELFMIPYNRKLWGVPLEELSLAWMGRFVPQPDEETVLSGCVAPRPGGVGYNAKFLYPARGGIQSLSDGLAARLHTAPTLNTKIVSVDLETREALCSDGERIPFSSIVSSVPLPNFAQGIQGLPAKLAEPLSSLRATTVSYVGLGVRSPGPRFEGKVHWVYFPEERFPFYRAGCASAAVPSLAPEGAATYYVEFSHPPTEDGEPPTGLVEAAVEGLRACGMIHADDPVEMSVVRSLKGAYVIVDHAHAAATEQLLGWLASKGLHSVGRYGRWTYSSMEDALLDGRGAADALLSKRDLT